MTATDPLALAGRDGRPLTAVTRIDLEPSAFLLDEVAGHIGDAISGVIVAGRQLDPELREPLAHLARVSGFPILAEPTSQLRCGPHDRSHVIAAYDLLLRDERFARSVVPDLVLRFGEMPTSKPLRAWLAASGASEIVVDPYGGWNEPSNRAAAILRADPTELASGWAARLEKEPRGGARGLARGRAARAGRARRPSSATAGRDLRAGPAPRARRAPTATATSSTPPRACRSATRRPSSPPATTDALFLCNRGANGIDGLISSGIGAAHASGRPTTIVTGDLGLLHDIGGLAALRDVSTPVRIVVIDNDGGGIFHFLPQEQALGGEEFEALLGTPRGVDVAKAAALFDLPHRRLESLAELPEALAAGTGLIEVRTDRTTNVAAHRHLQQRVQAALAALPLSEGPGTLDRSLPLLRAGEGPRSLARLLSQQRQQRLQLDLGLGQLGGRVGAGDDADAGEEVGLAVAQQGAAQGDAELAVLGRVHPADRAGVPAAVHALELGDRRGGRGPGLAADGRGRVQHPGQLDRRARLGQLGDHRRRQVLDVRHLDDLRLGRRLDPDRVRAQGADDPLGDDPLLAAVLVAAQQLLAEVVVDGGVGAAPGRAGEGDGRDAGAGAAHQQLRAGADEGRLGRAAAEAEAGRELLAHGAEEGRRVVGGAGADDDLAGEHDLAHLPRADPGCRRGDRRLRSRRAGGRCGSRRARSGAGRASAAAPRRAGRRAAPRARAHVSRRRPRAGRPR